MDTARLRSLLATTAVAALLLHGLSGHGVPQLPHDEMAGAAVLCLLLATVVASAAIPRPRPSRPAIAPPAASPYAGEPPDSPLDARARASPPALQRFRN